MVRDRLFGEERVVKIGSSSYRLPAAHVSADLVLLDGIRNITDGCRLSINDFGAGVGQYGHELQRDGCRWHGYDGAGDVDEYTTGLVHFVDLTMPLALPRADWVVSLEVGEHVPRQFERAYIENLHVHNCRGVILSWAQPNQPGHGHVNAHSPAYVRDIFQELGYAYDDRLSQAMRNGPGRTWSYHSRPGREPATDPSGKAHWWLRGAGVQVFRKQGGCQRLT